LDESNHGLVAVLIKSVVIVSSEVSKRRERLLIGSWVVRGERLAFVTGHLLRTDFILHVGDEAHAVVELDEERLSVEDVPGASDVELALR